MGRDVDSEERAKLEHAIRDPWTRGDFRAAATVAVRGYGPQILGFLVATNHDEEDGAEAFAVFCEDLWRGLAGFSWQCSFRTWAYTLARHASTRVREGQVRRDRRHVHLSENAELAELAATVRTETLSYLRTETKSKVAELREALPDDDRMLLILRVDRELAWSDLARVMLPEGRPGEPVTEAALRREAARLRKRYQLVKARLLTQLGGASPSARGSNP